MTALQVSTVLACVKIIGNGVSTLPWHVYEVSMQDRRPLKSIAYDHELYDLIRYEPNPEMTAKTFRSTLQCHMLLWGNGYAEIQRDAAARIVCVWPRNPARTRPVRITCPMRMEGTTYPTGTLFYVTNETMGDEISSQDDPQTRVGPDRFILAEDMLHFPGLSLDGRLGQSTVYLARQIIGLALATEKHAAKYFGNGAVPRGILSLPGAMRPEAIENLRRSWQEAHGGENAHKTAVLEMGVKYEQIGSKPAESQLVEVRKNQRVEIATVFNVPLHMVGEAEQAKSNVEQTSIDFLTYCLNPWLETWHQECTRKIFPRKNGQPRRYTIKADTHMLRYPDSKSRADFYSKGKNWGFLNTDDIHELEDMNPVGGSVGTAYWAPVNMVDASTGMLVGQTVLPDEPVEPSDDEPVEPSDDGSVEPSDDGSVEETKALRSRLASRYVSVYERLFRDAFGRFSVRASRRMADLERVMSPVLYSIADVLLQSHLEARGQDEAPPNLRVTPFISGYMRVAHDRLKELKPEVMVARSSAETLRALNALEDLVLRALDDPLQVMYAMRHGHTAANDDGIYRSWLPNDIDAVGHAEAMSAVTFLKDKGIRKIVSGDLLRLRTTAADVAAGLGDAKVGHDPRLNSWNIGKFVGKSIKDNQADLDRYIQNPDEVVPGGESLNAFKMRNAEIFAELEARNASDGPILVVTNRSNIAAREGSSFSGYKSSVAVVGTGGIVAISADGIKIVYGKTEAAGSIIS